MTRRIGFWPGSGRVRQRRLADLPADPPVPKAAPGGEVDLF